MLSISDLNVATIAPMKRGLKVPRTRRSGCKVSSSNHCPDEKGTESQILELYHQHTFSSNHCPDEKGTESQLFHDGYETVRE